MSHIELNRSLEKRRSLSKIWRRFGALAVVLLSTTVLAGRSGDLPQDTLVIVGGQVIDGTGKAPVDNTAVYIKGGLIERIDIVRDGKYPEGPGVLPAFGKVLVPGIVDSHTHIDSVGGVPVSNEQEDLVREYYPRAFLFHGVTTVINLSAHEPDEVLALRDRVRQSPDTLAPRIYTGASNFTVNGGWSGRHGGGLASGEEIDSRLTEYARRGFDLVKIINEDGLGEDPIFNVIPQDYMERIARVSRANGLPVFIHATDADEYMRAIAVEPRGIVHGLVTPIEKGSPIIPKLRENDIFVVPTIVLFEAFVRFRDRPELLNDPLLAASVPDFILEQVHDQPSMQASYQKMDSILRMDAASWAREAVTRLKENTKKMAAAGVRIAIGTDSGGAVVHAFQGYNSPREMEIIEQCCMDAMQTLVAATRNGADMIGASDKFGTLEPGKSADILILNSSPLEDMQNIRDFDRMVVRGRVMERSSLSYQAFSEEQASSGNKSSAGIAK